MSHDLQASNLLISPGDGSSLRHLTFQFPPHGARQLIFGVWCSGDMGPPGMAFHPSIFTAISSISGWDVLVAVGGTCFFSNCRCVVQRRQEGTAFILSTCDSFSVTLADAWFYIMLMGECGLCEKEGGEYKWYGSLTAAKRLGIVWSPKVSLTCILIQQIFVVSLPCARTLLTSVTCSH